MDFPKFLFLIAIALIAVPLYLASETCKFVFWLISHPETKLYLEANLEALGETFGLIASLVDNLRFYSSQINSNINLNSYLDIL